MNKLLLIIIIFVLIAGCATPRESVDFSLERQNYLDNQIKTTLIDGVVLGASIVTFISLIGFAVFYLVGKRDNQ
jgi:hypothetical protein